MSIACDTARALLYLHTAAAKSPLVHRDVKRYDHVPLVFCRCNNNA